MGFLGKLSIGLSVVFLGIAVWFSTSKFLPKEYHLPPPPALTGLLTVNKPKVLEKLLEGQVLGPESAVIENDVIYTCTLDGMCLKIVDGKIAKSVPVTAHATNCDGKRETIPICGRPLGIRRFNSQQFIVADAVLGLLLINFEEETKEVLLPSTTVVEKKRLGFPDDLDIVDNDTILFTDLSAKYGYSDCDLAFFEHIRDGRLLEYKVSTGQLRVLMDGLAVANGVQLHPDKNSVLVCETAMARIHRYYFAGPKKGTQQIFVDNLPGFPDNIRISRSGDSFYVALPFHRSEQKPHIFDRLGPWPLARKFIGELLKILPDNVLQRFVVGSTHGIVLQLDLNGMILRSWHDPEGTVISHISEVDDDGGDFLYLSSFVNNYIGRMSKE
ncbi:hypothetical protein niasHT_020630 [Heterodera trifolii]|uniref:Strictosidine synthase conserved region domain-containing protein n=1 Tax=Heterodera trifolii TaxID=157864 RepID=A0ABD2KKY7_9BILA